MSCCGDWTGDWTGSKTPKSLVLQSQSEGELVEIHKSLWILYIRWVHCSDLRNQLGLALKSVVRLKAIKIFPRSKTYFPLTNPMLLKIQLGKIYFSLILFKPSLTWSPRSIIKVKWSDAQIVSQAPLGTQGIFTMRQTSFWPTKVNFKPTVKMLCASGKSWSANEACWVGFKQY